MGVWHTAQVIGGRCWRELITMPSPACGLSMGSRSISVVWTRFSPVCSAGDLRAALTNAVDPVCFFTADGKKSLPSEPRTRHADHVERVEREPHARWHVRHVRDGEDRRQFFGSRLK